MAVPQPALRVLVIEDDDDTAQSTSLLLRTLGHESEAVPSAVAALERAPVFHPDVMLVDLAMPGCDGFELANRFKHNPAFDKTPMIAVTGFVDPKHRDMAFDAGFDGFVSKPFTIGDLEDVCNRVGATIGRAMEPKKAATTSRKLSRRRSDFWLNRHRRE
jgi:CheY-like chemotaxis protein